MRKFEFLKRGTPEREVLPSSMTSSKQAKANSDPAVTPDEQPLSRAPPVFLRKLRRAAVATGCDVRLRVSVAGHPKPALCWYRNDSPIASDGQDYGGLWIRDCRPTDGGLYTCVAVNRLGEARSSAVLAVLDLGEGINRKYLHKMIRKDLLDARKALRSVRRGSVAGPSKKKQKDSDNTEDETAEPQVPMETKGHQAQALSRQPAGVSTKMGDHIPDTRGRGASDQDPVVEREMLALGCRAPGPQEPFQPDRNQLDTVSRGTSPHVQPPSTKIAQSPTFISPLPSPPMSDPATPHNSQKKAGDGRDDTIKTKPSKSSGSSQSSGSQDSPSLPTPKLPLAGSKIFEKVRAFEERRHSVDVPKVSGPRSWAHFGRTASCDSEDGGSQPAIPKDNLKSDVAQKRSFFKQRASSLEDQPSYAQKVQNFQSKFSEELLRIKKLVGRPNIKKVFFTEQLCQSGKQSLGKLEPIPPQVVQKLQDREQALEEKDKALPKEPLPKETLPKETLSQEPKEVVSQKSLRSQRKRRTELNEEQTEEQSSSLPLGSNSNTGNDTSVKGMEEGIATPVKVPVIKLPGQCSPRPPRKSPNRESPTPTLFPQLPKGQPSYQNIEQPLPKKDRKSESPLVQRDLSPVQERPVQQPPKPPRLASSITAVSGPKLEKGREEMRVKASPPALKLTIPTIVVEDEPMEEEEDMNERDQTEAKRNERKARTQRTRGKSHRSRSMSPEQDSLDDSYMSTEEDPGETPMFELPLRDAAAAAGSEVLLQCVIVGNPVPQVRWRRGDVAIRDSPTHMVKVEGERHSLTLKKMVPSDAGTYQVTAVNKMGQASCTATLFIKAEPVQVHRGNLSLPFEVSSSPTPSDEEYLSPIDEGMEFGELPWHAPKSLENEVSPFKEPPAFKVALGDQVVTEGQEVTMSVQVSGLPKPMVYWFRDRVTIKTDGQHIVSETEDGKCELKIKSAQKSDAGVYICKIINEYGKKLTECRLEVQALPTQSPLAITRPVQDVKVKAGETALFECLMAGPQEVDVDWLSNGKLIQPALLDCKMHLDGRRCRLLLRSVHEDDSGTYTCKLSSAKEELTTSANLKVTPSKEPLFTRKLEVLEVIEGRTARFDCKVSGSPRPNITWTHCDQPVVESDTMRFLTEGGRHSLVLSHVMQESAGFYTAIARNTHGQVESAAELYVQEPRPAISSHMAKLEKMPSIPEEPEVLESEVERRTMPDFVKPLCDVEVIEGKEAVLKCKVAGLPYPAITWYHNGKKIDSTEDRKMTQYRDVHSLLIRSACHGHSGVYKSVISNKVGKAACYAHLYVTDILPDPPDGPPVIEAITGRTISLSWKRPKNLDPSIDPSSLMYAVQQQPLGSIQWTIIASSLRETSYTVNSLSKGVRYAFRVLTATGKAFSKPSQPTDLVQLIDRGQYLRKAPVILDKPDVVYVVENQSVTIPITLNHVQATVTWKRRGVVLVNKPGTFEMFMPDDDQHTLKLMRVRNMDVGQLLCTATNQHGSDLCTLLLAMAAAPTFETIMEDLDVCVGETPRFAVVVDGKPDPDILWYKDNVLLSESSHFTFVYDDRECSLVILNARPEDSGVYTCTAKNLAGAVSCKAELSVHTAKKEVEVPMEDEATILRRMRRLTDYYDLHKEIGRGTFSYVKRVTQKAGKVEYAAKFISARAKRKKSALREMGLLSELDHERIVYFHDAFEKKNVVVIITELCHEEFLERLTKKTTIMESEIRTNIRQLLEGIDYLHQKDIIHLDIKPENILMADRNSDQIRICDFGNALKLTPSDPQYCKYGTPEYVSPEIVNQTPVFKATDIWPVGVITYLCLTGVSPFTGENDCSTLLNIRNYNVAFEESMFADLCREAKGFVIKLLVADRQRPDSTECLRHPWFKTLTKGKSISTAMHKQVLARRKWQRSLISYKSKMVMRSIPELLDDSSGHISLAVPRHLKEGSPPPSSSSDSGEDIDELPFIPMPLTMVFSGSRMSLTEIPGDEDVIGGSNSASTGIGTHQREEPMESEPSAGGKDEDPGEMSAEQPKKSLQKGLSMEAEHAQTKSRRATMRRGSSADSALLLHVTPKEEAVEKSAEESQKNLKKAVSMELPHRSHSPSPGKLSQEDYALKLELMRQRLLRGGSVDKKMSGLRGPLLETLGVDDERRTASLDRNLRRNRHGAAGLTWATSTDSPGEALPMTKMFRKSVSFSQGDPEPMPLHRRSGAPLEIPTAQSGERRLQEATSMSALMEQNKLESRPVSPREIPSKTPSPDPEDEECEKEAEEVVSQKEPPSLETPITEGMERMEEPEVKVQSEYGRTSVYSNITPTIVIPNQQAHTPTVTAAPIPTPKPSEPPATSEHPAVFSKVASADWSTGNVSLPETPTSPTPPPQPCLRTDIKDIDSEEVFESRFKKRESSLTRGLRRFTRAKSEEKSPVLPRRMDEEVYRPGAMGAPLEFVSIGLQEKSKSVQDLREVERDPGLSLIGRLSMRTKKMPSTDKKEDKQKEEASEPTASRHRVSWALGLSKSLDKKGVETAIIDRDAETERDHLEMNRKKVPESPVLAMRRKFESKVAGISEIIRSRSEERKEDKVPKEPKPIVDPDTPKEEEKQEHTKISESPVLAMRRKFESKVGGLSLRIRSKSEEREDAKEPKLEGKRIPLLSRLRNSQSEGGSLKKMEIPENQLVSQSVTAASKESLESTSSSQSAKAAQTPPESDRRSRWDRWGLSRSKKEKTSSQSSISSTKEDDSSGAHQYNRSSSDFPPVFHIKLRDHILLEGDPVTLSCLPAGSPHPKIAWIKDKQPLEIDDRMNLMASPDGRQLIMIMKTTKKDAGLYECVATNHLASVTSSCTLSLACVPKRPGTPEIPQTYNNTALVLWKPADTKAPCTYSLEKKTEGDDIWLIVATGVADCYYNVTDLPSGCSFRFRVACVNKAGQGPYSNCSEKVGLDAPVTSSPPPVIVKTLPSSSAPAVTSTVTVPAVKSVPTALHRKSVSIVTPSQSPAQTLIPSPAPSPPQYTAPSPSQATAAGSPSAMIPATSTTSPPKAKTPPVTVLPLSAAIVTPTPKEAKAALGKVTFALPLSTPMQPPPKVKPIPPLVLPKPKNPINVVPPITQTPPISPTLVAEPALPSKPISPVPTYAAAATARVAPTPMAPPVVLVSSMSPIGEGAGSPTSFTITGRVTPKPSESTLRQGVPQKPYTFMDERARGRFGVMRDCRENASGKLFMAKLVPYEQESKQAVVQEYEILKSLRNDRIMALHEAYVTPRYLVLITECCAGKELLYSLTDRLRYCEDDVVGYIVQILQGLEYLHNRRILHLDIKPDNIMVTNLNVIKIIDFGSAQNFNPLFLRHYSRNLGTLEYTAPEMLKGEVVGPPADIWSIGILTYIMLSGRLPFLEKDPLQTETKIQAAKIDTTKLYPNVSQSASTFLKKVLSNYPWSRPTTKDCFSHVWLQDSYLMKLRRQTLTFTTARLKEFLADHQRRRAEAATKHKVLLRSYQSAPQSSASS